MIPRCVDFRNKAWCCEVTDTEASPVPDTLIVCGEDCIQQVMTHEGSLSWEPVLGSAWLRQVFTECLLEGEWHIVSDGLSATQFFISRLSGTVVPTLDWTRLGSGTYTVSPPTGSTYLQLMGDPIYLLRFSSVILPKKLLRTVEKEPQSCKSLTCGFVRLSGCHSIRQPNPLLDEASMLPFRFLIFFLFPLWCIFLFLMFSQILYLTLLHILIFSL